jgi:hypothetical protein
LPPGRAIPAPGPGPRRVRTGPAGGTGRTAPLPRWPRRPGSAPGRGVPGVQAGGAPDRGFPRCGRYTRGSASSRIGYGRGVPCEPSHGLRALRRPRRPGHYGAHDVPAAARVRPFSRFPGTTAHTPSPPRLVCDLPPGFRALRRTRRPRRSSCATFLPVSGHYGAHDVLAAARVRPSPRFRLRHPRRPRRGPRRNGKEPLLQPPERTPLTLPEFLLTLTCAACTYK